MVKSNSLPIGIFDSGLGGLTVVKQIMSQLPHENLVYLGDNARVPYGGRSRETVTKFSLENSVFLINQNVKCIVIACNTSSALAGDELKKKLNLPVFDVIDPATDDAKRVSDGGKIGVIGTRGTIGSGAYPFKYTEACPLFVPFIEEGEYKNPALRTVAKKYLSAIKKFKIDTLILGCTHYPIIKNIIAKEMGPNVKIIDPGLSVAVSLKTYLTENGMLNNQKNEGVKKYFVTDYTERFVKMAEMFLGHKIESTIRKATVT